MSENTSEIVQRTYKVLVFLQKEKHTVKRLAERLHVSERIVRRTIQGLKELEVAFEDVGRGFYKLSDSHPFYKAVLNNEIKGKPTNLKLLYVMSGPVTVKYDLPDNTKTIAMTKYGHNVFTKLFKNDARTMRQRFMKDMWDLEGLSFQNVKAS